MTKKKLAVIITAAVLFIAALIFTLTVLLSGSEKHIAEITSDGNVIRVIDLSTAPDETFTVESANGTNTVTVKNGTISVTEASCPDKICVKHGELRTEMLPIVCLPNRLIITYR